MFRFQGWQKSWSVLVLTWSVVSTGLKWSFEMFFFSTRVKLKNDCKRHALTIISVCIYQTLSITLVPMVCCKIRYMYRKTIYVYVELPIPTTFKLFGDKEFYKYSILVNLRMVSSLK